MFQSGFYDLLAYRLVVAIGGLTRSDPAGWEEYEVLSPGSSMIL
jgi:hypothetical protein